LVTQEAGSSVRLSRVRRKDGKYGWLRLHPRRLCACSGTCACPRYWHINVIEKKEKKIKKKGESYTDHIPYCRILGWISKASSAQAELTDKQWAKQAVTHHPKGACHRIRWKVEKVWVKDDDAALSGETRATHIKLDPPPRKRKRTTGDKR